MKVEIKFEANLEETQDLEMVRKICQVIGANPVTVKTTDVKKSAPAQDVKKLAPAPAPAPAAAPSAGGQTVEAPMPGKILNIKVSEGQAVKFGEVVVIMEAMKMETEIVAPADGTVSKILVKAGDSVDTGAALVALN